MLCIFGINHAAELPSKGIKPPKPVTNFDPLPDNPGPMNDGALLLIGMSISYVAIKRYSKKK